MDEIILKLTPEESAILQRLVDSAIGDTRVEVHHTHHTPTFRDDLKKEEDVLRGLLLKLQLPK